MVKILTNRYLLSIQFLIFNILNQNSIQCAARIQSDEYMYYADPKGIELRRAIFAGNLKKAEELIEQGININSISLVGHTVLFSLGFAKNNKKEMVELLIKKGADVNKIHATGLRTVLIDVVVHGMEDMCEILLNYSPDINIADREKRTALMLAAGRGEKKMVELLLHAGANIDLEDKNHRNALYYAKNKYFSEENETITLNKHEIVKMIEAEPARRAAMVTKWHLNLAKKIFESTAGILLYDISKLAAGYIVDNYNNVIELEKQNPNIIESSLAENETIINSRNKLKRKTVDTNSDNNNPTKKEKLSKSAIETEIIQLKEKKESLHKELTELSKKSNIDVTATIQKIMEEIEGIDDKIKAKENN